MSKPVNVDVRPDSIVLTIPKPDPIACEGCGRKYEYESLLASGSCNWANRSVATDLWRTVIQLVPVHCDDLRMHNFCPSCLAPIAEARARLDQAEHEIWRRFPHT
jgi:hypothetical protein